MKAVITDYQYDNVDQEKQLITKANHTFVDLTKNPDISLEDAVRDADGLIVQYTQITRQLISKMERCKLIVRYGIGVDNIDVEAASEKGIYVCNIPDYGIDEVSNHAIALMMALHRKIPQIAGTLKKGDWNYEGIIPIKRLSNSTLGLVGFGRIPRLVAKKMAGFGLNILVYDPFVDAASIDPAVRSVDFQTLCKESDIVSIHCPLSPQTEQLFNADIFGQMKPTAIIVNTARGAVIKEEDLISALQNGVIAAAGLDTFEQEPIDQNNPLLGMENVICTPHSAWYSDDAILMLQKKAGEEIVNVFSGGQPFNAVNRKDI